MKVMTKTAITTVVASDCREFMPPAWLARRLDAARQRLAPGQQLRLDDSVWTSLMTARKLAGGSASRVRRTCSSTIVDTPRPVVQPPARPASWYCPPRGGRSPRLRRERRNVHLHGEYLAVVRAFFLDQDIARLRTSAGMHRFLQRRFVVHDRQLPAAAACAPPRAPVPGSRCRIKRCAVFQPPSRNRAAMMASRASTSRATLAAAAAPFLTLAEPQVLSDLQLPRRTKQVAGAHDVRPQLGELSFLVFGKAAEKFLADDETTGPHRPGIPFARCRAPEQGVPRGVLRLRLARIRSVGERLLQKGTASKRCPRDPLCAEVERVGFICDRWLGLHKTSRVVR